MLAKIIAILFLAPGLTACATTVAERQKAFHDTVTKMEACTVFRDHLAEPKKKQPPCWARCDISDKRMHVYVPVDCDDFENAVNEP
ncbi:MAG: hypothetical protein RLZZ324_956 [Candidatus Parcubacteria bacterium]